MGLINLSISKATIVLFLTRREMRRSTASTLSKSQQSQG
jgi:hypothetical protein